MPPEFQTKDTQTHTTYQLPMTLMETKPDIPKIMDEISMLPLAPGLEIIQQRTSKGKVCAQSDGQEFFGKKEGSSLPSSVASSFTHIALAGAVDQILMF